VRLRGFCRFCDEVRHWARMRRHPEHLALGRRAEDLAHRYLEAEGLTVVDRNLVLPDLGAEIDLIALEGDTVVFVEVKSRSDAQAGDPLRGLDRGKQERLVRAAGRLLQRWRIPPGKARFDVVTVVLEPYEIRHYRAAWSPAGRDRLS